MENKVLSQNLEQIKHFNSNLANEILMFNQQKSNIELAQNENEEYNILFNSIPLHSINGAIQEAKQITETIEDKDNSIKIIYGFGLGYLADEFSNKLKKSKIVIYEPNLDILKYVFSIAQFDMFTKNNVILCTNKNDLADFIAHNTNETTEISISFLSSYKNLFFEDIKETLNFAQNIQGQIIGDKNTFIKKAPACFYHTLANLRKIANNPHITDLKDIYKNKTALIACAGPTLKENIETIKQNKDKFVIFALNPTLKTLFAHGITPDFIVAVESVNIIKQFEGVDYQNSHLILEAFVHRIIGKLKCKKTFNYISNENFLNPWLREGLKYDQPLNTIGTVSYTALQSAFIMGFKKIVLVGQDLAYKDGQCYSKECQWGALKCIFDENLKEYKIIVEDFENFANAFTSPAAPEEKYNIAKKRLETLNQNLCTVKGQNGEYLPSQTGYRVFIDCFSKTAKEFRTLNPNIELINSSTGGAQIDGFENVSLDEIAKNLEPIEKLDLSNFKSSTDKNYFIEKIEPLEQDLKEYCSYLEETLQIIEKLNKELKYKHIFTDSAIKYAKKYTELLSKLSKFKHKEPINILVVAQLYLIEKYSSANHFKDAKQALLTLEELIKNFTTIRNYATGSLEQLRNSKAFILKQLVNI